jgi:hypothetical protein
MHMLHVLVVLAAVTSCQDVGGTRPPDRAAAADAAGPSGEPAPTTGVPAEPMVIREASLEIEVEDCTSTVDSLRRMAEERDGFAQSVAFRADETNGSRSATIMIRVPEAALDRVLDEIDALAAEVRSRSVSASDVTEEYVDIEARLAVKRGLEQRFVQLLERAQSTSEALEVERALGAVREEIERIDGRRQFLRDRVRMATVTVEVVEPVPVLATLRTAASIGGRICLAMVQAVVAFCVATAPVLVVSGLVLAVVVRRRRPRCVV